jgi:SAM-dependent methyltransferase
LNLEDWPAGGETGKSYRARLDSGFFGRWLAGPLVLDVGCGPGKPVLPHAIAVDLGYPGYDGYRLPFETGAVDTVYSSHMLEHVDEPAATIRDWYRVIRRGGHIVCIVPHRDLYERRAAPPSRWNPDHNRFYTPAALLGEFELALYPNSYRVRHLADNDRGYDYAQDAERHPTGCYEIELVIEKR